MHPTSTDNIQTISRQVQLQDIKFLFNNFNRFFVQPENKKHEEDFNNIKARFICPLPLLMGYYVLCY